MTSHKPARTDDQNSAPLVNKSTPPNLLEELLDEEIAAVIGGFSHVQLPIIVEGSPTAIHRHDEGRPGERMFKLADRRSF